MDYKRFGEKHHLTIELDGKVAVVTMNRPEKRNAVNFMLHAGLEEALTELSYDLNVGAILLTGAGSAFCAGGDLVDFYPEEHSIRNSMRNKRLNWSLLHCEAPTIAAVNGPAAGLGATIALMCDVVFMADTAKIGDTHVRNGLTAGDGGQVIWPLLIGPNRAKEYLMAGEMIPASEAERIGLVNHAVPADQLMPRALEYAHKVANGAQASVRWTKMAINKMVEQQQILTLDFGMATEYVCSHGSEDTREAMAAFAEKRTPTFTGR